MSLTAVHPFRTILLLFLLAWSFSGCGNDDGSRGGGRGSSLPDDTEAVELRRIDAAGINRLLQRHAGEVVLLDFWATWCIPCVEEFPRLQEWHEEFGGRGLAIVAVNVENPDEAEDEVRRFLAGREHDFATGILDVPEYTAFVKSVDGRWGGEVPALFLYDRRGEQARAFFGSRETAEIRSAIVSLLGGTGAAGSPPPG